MTLWCEGRAPPARTWHFQFLKHRIMFQENAQDSANGMYIERSFSVSQEPVIGTAGRWSNGNLIIKSHSAMP